MNVVTQIGIKYFLVHNGDQCVGVIVWIENGTYVAYVDDLPVVAFANRDAAIEYVGVPEPVQGKHTATQRLDAVTTAWTSDRNPSTLQIVPSA